MGFKIGHSGVLHARGTAPTSPVCCAIVCAGAASVTCTAFYTAAGAGLELRQARIEGITQAVAEEVKGKHRQKDGQPREHRQEGSAEDVLTPFAQHGTPLGSGR